MSGRFFRKWRGGKWYFYKFGKDTPPLRMFTGWLQEPPEQVDMSYCTLLDVEDHGLPLWDRLRLWRL